MWKGKPKPSRSEWDSSIPGGRHQQPPRQIRSWGVKQRLPELFGGSLSPSFPNKAQSPFSNPGEQAVGKDNLNCMRSGRMRLQKGRQVVLLDSMKGRTQMGSVSGISGQRAGGRALGTPRSTSSREHRWWVPTQAVPALPQSPVRNADAAIQPSYHNVRSTPADGQQHHMVCPQPPR